MNAWAFEKSKLSSKSPTSFTPSPCLFHGLWTLAIGLALCLSGCRQAVTEQSLDNQPNSNNRLSAPTGSLAVAAVSEFSLNRLAEPGAEQPTTGAVHPPSKVPVVLFDSFHAHNFLDRGMVPGEYSYHRFTGLRRASALLKARNVEVRELWVGPITKQRLNEVDLVVLNLPSADRPPWLVSEIEAIEQFVRGGGGMIFVTDHSNCYYHQYHLLPLWDRLGLIPTFETLCERQPDCLLDSRQGPAWLLVRKFESHPITQGIQVIGTQTGGRVKGEGIVAWSSSRAFADTGASPLYGEGNMGLYGDLRYVESEEEGEQGVILARSIDRGRVVVISDQNSLGDGQITYADNWRLWLNACSWAGQIKFDVSTQNQWRESRDRQAQADVLLDHISPKDEPASPPAFDLLVGVQPDLNAPLPTKEREWHIECWEPFSRMPVHWGGTAPEQYYHYWCWLNRWCWTSAHEGPSNPAPQGHTLFMISQRDLADNRAAERLRKVLSQAGNRAVIYPESDLIAVSDDGQPIAPDRLAQARRQWLSDTLRQVVDRAELAELISTSQWHEQPIGHWQLTWQAGTLRMVPEALSLRNASFVPPEQQPTAKEAKWQTSLYHWLFD